MCERLRAGSEVGAVLDTSHEPHPWLLDVGEVVVGVVGEVIGLGIECVVGCLPLEFEVECAESAKGLALVRFYVVELAFTVLEGEVPLCGELSVEAVAQGGDELVAQEGQVGGVVSRLFFIDAVLVIVAVAEGEVL